MAVESGAVAKQLEEELAQREREDLARRELAKRIEEAKRVYCAYRGSQRGIELPVARISIEESDVRTTVHMDVSYKGTDYHFESVKPGDATAINTYLNSQPLVREKYANGQTVPPDATARRVAQFDARFQPGSPDGLYLYSGFVVTDPDTEAFLGLANLGGSGKNDGHAEMAFLNRADAWSSATPEIVEKYAESTKRRPLDKHYAGLGTVEVCTLLQYAAHLKQTGHTVCGKPLEGMNATARLDNPGSWKACAKAGMDVVDVDQNSAYGPDLRYQLCKPIP
jgi:hypothetical protein